MAEETRFVSLRVIRLNCRGYSHIILAPCRPRGFGSPFRAPGRGMETGLAVPFQLRANGDAPALPADYRNGNARRAADFAGAGPRARSMVLGARGNHRAKSCPRAGSRQSLSHGSGLD